jgi:hypothetical protein
MQEAFARRHNGLSLKNGLGVLIKTNNTKQR